MSAAPNTAPREVDADLAERTRATYSAWLRHGLAVAEQLAEEADADRDAAPAGDRGQPGTDPAEAPTWPGRSTPGRPTAGRPTTGRSTTGRFTRGRPTTGRSTSGRTGDAAPTRWKPHGSARPAPAGATVEEAVRTGWLVTTAQTGPDMPGPSGQAPLAGLTVAVKDVIDVAGLPVRNGTPGALWRTPESSAPAWERLRTAGAVCVGKSATHEMAWGVTTPQIPHPQDRERVTGGSSGGSAACVASGATAAGLGTDTGGSVRIPAALCGVVGFRPTTGSTDLGGVTPLAPQQDVVGPLAADVATCTAMLEVLLDRSLHSSADPTEAVRGMRVGVLARPGRLDATVADALAAAVESLRSVGVDVVECDTALFRQAGSISLLTMLHCSARLYSATVREHPDGFGGEARALLTLGDSFSASDVERLDRARRVLVGRTATLFATAHLDAVLTPTTPCTAPRRGAESVEIEGRSEPVPAALTRFTSWAAAASLPAVSVPVPTSGLPVGVQAMAPPYREDICVRLAMTIEELTRKKAL